MSAVRDFLVPDLGEGLEDATITTWLVAVGDEVALNQPLCTVETNKAEVEIPSPYAGRVAELGGTEGQTLPVGSVLARIAVAGAPPTAPPTTQPKPTASVRTPVLVGYGVDAGLDGSRRRPRAKPPVRKLARDLNVDLAAVHPGSGPDGIVTRADVLAAEPRAADPGTAVGGVRLEMARRMALSRREIPDAHASVEVDGSALLRLRDRWRADGVADVTPFALLLRMVALALTRHPVLNATWLDTAEGPRVHEHNGVHLGIGVAAPRGLLVPVMTDAHRRTTRELDRKSVV